MKKVLTTLFTLAIVVTTMQAQIKSPAPSPMSKVEQMVGLTTVEIEYSRPGVKDRTIFGADGLVPFGQMWRTGANASTKISFDKDVMVEGKELKAGTYALYTIPGEKEWAVIFYKDLSNWGTPEEYKQEDEALKVMVASKMLDRKVENFTIAVDDLRNDGGTLQLMWEKTLVPISLTVHTDKEVMASIESTLNGPSARDYYLSGRYYHESGKDLSKAYDYLHKANEMDPRFWQLRAESLVLADMKKYEEAIAVAEKSKEMAQKEGNMDYVRMNEQSIAMWKKEMMEGTQMGTGKKMKKEDAKM